MYSRHGISLTCFGTTRRVDAGLNIGTILEHSSRLVMYVMVLRLSLSSVYISWVQLHVFGAEFVFGNVGFMLGQAWSMILVIFSMC